MIMAVAVAAAVFVPVVHAGDISNYSLSSDHRLTFSQTRQASSAQEQYSQAHFAGIRPIYNNIGYFYPKGRYISDVGWTLSGPTSIIGQQIWIGAQFTPKHSGMVVEVDAALGYVTGTMGLTLNLYTDAGGVPGTLLASFKAKKLPTFGTCCDLVRAFDGTGVPVTGGAPYWITAETTAATADEWGVWNLNDVDQVDMGTNAVNNGAGWLPSNLIPAPSFAVFSG
jgi:hypothetical protein